MPQEGNYLMADENNHLLYQGVACTTSRLFSEIKVDLNCPKGLHSTQSLPDGRIPLCFCPCGNDYTEDGTPEIHWRVLITAGVGIWRTAGPGVLTRQKRFGMAGLVIGKAGFEH